MPRRESPPSPSCAKISPGSPGSPPRPEGRRAPTLFASSIGKEISVAISPPRDRDLLSQGPGAAAHVPLKPIDPSTRSPMPDRLDAVVPLSPPAAPQAPRGLPRDPTFSHAPGEGSSFRAIDSYRIKNDIKVKLDVSKCKVPPCGNYANAIWETAGITTLS